MDVTARAELMLTLAPYAGVDLDALERARRRLVTHEDEFDRATTSSARAELAQLMANDIAELAYAYKMMARAVDRGGEA